MSFKEFYETLCACVCPPSCVCCFLLFMAPNRGLLSNYLGYRGMANRMQAALVTCTDLSHAHLLVRPTKTHTRACVFFVGITVQWRNSPSVHGEQSSYYYLKVFWCDSTMFFQKQFTDRIIWSLSKRAEVRKTLNYKRHILMNSPLLQYAAS